MDETVKNVVATKLVAESVRLQAQYDDGLISEDEVKASLAAYERGFQAGLSTLTELFKVPVGK